MKIKSTLYIMVLGMIFSNCTNDGKIKVPQGLGELDLSRSISGEEAISEINKLHGLAVAADINVIAEYGVEKKDLLYVSYYSEAEEAQKIFNQMIEKMKAAKKSPFTHIRSIKAYSNQAYIALGLGAFHYIYVSGNYVLWLQTYQAFGRSIPEELLEVYPVILKDDESRELNL